MSKLKMGSDFSDDESGDSTGGKEVKEDKSDVDKTSETNETSESHEDEDENDTQPGSSTGENDTSGDADDSKKGVGTKGQTEEEKPKALEALRTTEKELDNDVSELDKEIEMRRQRISERRAGRRERKEILNTIDHKIPDSKEDDLSDIDPDSLKIVERIIKAKGYVSRDEFSELTFEQRQKDAESNFFETHKDYLPENDKEDFLYNELKKELSLYAKPKDPKLISQIYERAHKAVYERFPTHFKSTPNLKDQQKNIIRNKTAGTGGGQSGGSSSGGSSRGAKLSDTQIQRLRDGGWTEEDIERLNSK